MARSPWVLGTKRPVPYYSREVPGWALARVAVLRCWAVRSVVGSDLSVALRRSPFRALPSCQESPLLCSLWYSSKGNWVVRSIYLVLLAWREIPYGCIFAGIAIK